MLFSILKGMKQLILASVVLVAVCPADAQSGTIAFTSYRDGNGEIYSMNADGSAQTNLTKTANVEESWPQWRPDGTKIVYARTDDIWTMDADGANQTRIPVGHGPTNPDYDPTSQNIAYSAFGGFDNDVFIMPESGSPKTPVAINPLGDYFPRYSPDGSKISFSTFNLMGDYVPDVYVVNTNGSGQTRLTFSGRNANADWSPDGTRLVFQSGRDGNYEIYVMNADGSNQTRLTNNPANDGNATFSPDGTQIAFVSDRSGNEDIWVMNANGSNPRQLTTSTATDSSPSWATSAPAISINDVTITEGNSATTKQVFTITLSEASEEVVSVNYSTQGISAASPADFTSVNGILTFVPGETTKTIAVPVHGDTLDEANETFRLNLSNLVNAKTGDLQGLGTIVDDDRAPSLSINDVSIAEGNSGTVNATFTVNLSARSGQRVSVLLTLYNGTASAPGDYTGGKATLVFAPDETSKTFSVPVRGDVLDEANETFFAVLSAPVNASMGRGRGVGTILDDDAPPAISVDDVRITEGHTGQRVAAFRLKLSAPSGQSVRVTVATVNGSAIAGDDYVSLAPTQIAFTTGNLYAYARVLINGDVFNEPDETFLLNLGNPQNATITDNQAIGTISNDDASG